MSRFLSSSHHHHRLPASHPVGDTVGCTWRHEPVAIAAAKRVMIYARRQADVKAPFLIVSIHADRRPFCKVARNGRRPAGLAKRKPQHDAIRAMEFAGASLPFGLNSKPEAQPDAPTCTGCRKERGIEAVVSSGGGEPYSRFNWNAN